MTVLLRDYHSNDLNLELKKILLDQYMRKMDNIISDDINHSFKWWNSTKLFNEDVDIYALCFNHTLIGKFIDRTSDHASNVNKIINSHNRFQYSYHIAIVAHRKFYMLYRQEKNIIQN